MKNWTYPKRYAIKAKQGGREFLISRQHRVEDAHKLAHRYRRLLPHWRIEVCTQL